MAGTAVVLTTIGIGLLWVLADSDEGSAHASWVRQADRLCRQATARFEQMPPVHLSTYKKVVSKIVANERRMVRDLRALRVPDDDRPSVGRLTALLDQQVSEIDAVLAAYTGEKLRFVAYRQHRSMAQRLDDEIKSIAQALGLGACQHAPVLTRYL